MAFFTPQTISSLGLAIMELKGTLSQFIFARVLRIWFLDTENIIEFWFYRATNVRRRIPR